MSLDPLTNEPLDTSPAGVLLDRARSARRIVANHQMRLSEMNEEIVWRNAEIAKLSSEIEQLEAAAETLA